MGYLSQSMKQVGRSGYRATTLNSSAMSGNNGKNIGTTTSDNSYPNTTTTHCSNKGRGLRLPSSTTIIMCAASRGHLRGVPALKMCAMLFPSGHGRVARNNALRKLSLLRRHRFSGARSFVPRPGKARAWGRRAYRSRPKIRAAWGRRASNIDPRSSNRSPSAAINPPCDKLGPWFPSNKYRCFVERAFTKKKFAPPRAKYAIFQAT